MLTFPLARLITFSDINYAAMYPMCVCCCCSAEGDARMESRVDLFWFFEFCLSASGASSACLLVVWDIGTNLRSLFFFLFLLRYPFPAELVVVMSTREPCCVCRYGQSSEDVDMGRWVKHAEEKHNITVQWLPARIGGIFDHEWSKKVRAHDAPTLDMITKKIKKLTKKIKSSMKLDHKFI